VSLTVLSVAFPLSPVSPDSSGGAEQILSEIDRGLVKRGHKSLVIARPDSRVAGTLIPTRPIAGLISHQDWVAADDSIRRAMRYAFDRYPIDVVHMHGLYFSECLPEGDVPVLVTLHVPLTWYKPGSLHPYRPRTYLHCVSRAQSAGIAGDFPFLPEIENGVRTDLLRPRSYSHKKKFVMGLGRICPEKGFHLALQAAKQAGIGMLLAGQIFPFTEHQRYFTEQIAPELDMHRRYLGPIGFKQKRRLLPRARCLLVTSLVPETSSLVAREALSCGTPIVAFDRGALREVIIEGKTGFLVHRPGELADAIRACRYLDPANCRRAALARFRAETMVDKYIATYHQILQATCRVTELA
jgi:glycosyltransferase involved in cell wall biosynthesis